MMRELQSDSSSGSLSNEPIQEAEGEPVEHQENPLMNRIEFNFENPNGGVINFNADLSRILEEMGMTEREFLNLPH